MFGAPDVFEVIHSGVTTIYLAFFWLGFVQRLVPSKFSSLWTRPDQSYVFFNEKNDGEIGLAIWPFVLEIMEIYQIKRVKFEI